MPLITRDFDFKVGKYCTFVKPEGCPLLLLLEIIAGG